MKSSSYTVIEEILSFSSSVFIIRDAPADALRQERERIVSQLCVELIERYRYQPHQMKFNELIAIPSVSGETYLECDVLVGDKNTPILLIKAAAPEEYDRNRESALNHLFKLGQAYKRKEKTAFAIYLIYYTRVPNHGNAYSRCMSIDFFQYPDRETWRKASEPAGSEMPSALDKK